VISSIARASGEGLRMRVLVAETHSEGRKAICDALRTDSRLELTACVRDAASAVSRAAELAPDVVVLDSELPFGALAAAQEIRSRMPTVHLILVNGPEDGDLLEALATGVSAYLPRGTRRDGLVRAIAEVAAGEVVLSRDQVALLVEAVRDPAVLRRHVAATPALTAREWQVLELLRKDMNVADVARRLMLSPVTVRSHTQSIRRKLGSEAVRS
jgi:DNA-binding NarL/FixJ family response regulator